MLLNVEVVFTYSHMNEMLLVSLQIQWCLYWWQRFFLHLTLYTYVYVVTLNCKIMKQPKLQCVHLPPSG